MVRGLIIGLVGWLGLAPVLATHFVSTLLALDFQTELLRLGQLAILFASVIAIFDGHVGLNITVLFFVVSLMLHANRGNGDCTTGRSFLIVDEISEQSHTFIKVGLETRRGPNLSLHHIQLIHLYPIKEAQNLRMLVDAGILIQFPPKMVENWWRYELVSW